MTRPWKLSVSLVFGVLMALSFSMFSSVKPAEAANPTTIPFQGKVVSNASGLVGTNVADGTYTFIFKLYNTATSTGSTVTSATCSGDTHCLWAESDSVTVTAGVFQVNLGANTSLSSIDFNAQNALYLGVEFNADTAEMSPRPQLQSVPYAFNSDKLGGFTAAQLAQLQTGTVTAQTGALSVTGAITSAATVQGATLVATGAVQGNSLNINSSAFAVSSAGAITASTGIANSGGYIQSGTTANTLSGATTLSAAGTALSVTNNALIGGTFTVQSATYTTSQVVINDGQTNAPPAYPNSYLPTLSVLVNNTSSSRPLFFGYESGGAYEAYLTSGACGAFTQMCFDLGNGANDYTALQNVGTTLYIGGGNGATDDGAFATVAIAPSGTAATTVGGTLAVTGATSLAGNLTITQAAGSQFKIAAAAVQTADMFSITNTGKPITADGINAEQIDYYAALGAAASQASALRVNITNTSTVAGSTTNGLRLVTTTSGSSGNTNGLKVDAITAGTGTASALNIGTGWTNLLQSTYLNVSGGTNPVISSTAGQNLSISSLGAGGLSLTSGSGTLGLNAATLQRVATGTTTLDLDDAANTVLQLFNSGTGVANLQLYGGVLCTGAAACTVGGTTQRLDNAGNLTNIGNYTGTGTLTTTGNITTNSAITGGEVNDNRTEASNAATFAYTESTPALGYYLSSTGFPGTTGLGGTAPVNTVSTFTVSGLPNVADGTIAFFTINNSKPAAVNTANTATTHSVVLVIGTQTVATLVGASSNALVNISRSFTVMRMNGTWKIVGEGFIGTQSNANSTATIADFAEYIDYSGDVKPQPGDVLAVGDENTSVKRSAKDYDNTVLGVVSTSPYQVGGADDGHSVILALTGRVPVNVSLENGAIKAGDKLTASSTAGEAMKATKAGHIIGTALSDYDGSQDMAQVIVQLGVGYDNPSSDAAAEVTSPSSTDDGALQPNTDTTPAVTTDNGITTAGSKAFRFVDGQGLDLTSDVSGNAISLVDTPDNLAKANANGIFVQQGKAAAGATTGLSGALTIDNADANLPIGAAINITNTGGGGYTSVISSTNFSVSGTGDVSANGAYISKSGSFQLVDASGKKLINFDNNGNGTLTGALNVASANVSGGLTVGGDLNVAGLSTFQKLSTFLAKTVFRQDVEFDGHITVANDSAGYASLRPGETTVHVTFQKPYDSAPVVNASVTSGQFILSQVANITPQGFDITIQTADKNPLNFSWTAVAVNNPQTATNPVPPTPATPPAVTP